MFLGIPWDQCQLRTSIQQTPKSLIISFSPGVPAFAGGQPHGHHRHHGHPRQPVCQHHAPAGDYIGGREDFRRCREGKIRRRGVKASGSRLE